MPHRRTARVLLFDADDRILLMKGRLPSDPDAPGVWFTVGGGVEPEETFEQGAAREIVEETGFADVILGPEVWTAERVLKDRKGRPVLFKERYFVARCQAAPLSRAGWQAMEHEFIDDIRWWSAEELLATLEPVFPEDLPSRLSDAAAQAPIIRRAEGAIAPPIPHAADG